MDRTVFHVDLCSCVSEILNNFIYILYLGSAGNSGLNYCFDQKEIVLLFLRFTVSWKNDTRPSWPAGFPDKILEDFGFHIIDTLGVDSQNNLFIFNVVS